MAQTNDPIERMLLKLLLVFLTSVIVYYILKPIIGLFGITGTTGNVITDTIFFTIIPMAIIFIVIYRIFRIFYA